MAEKECDAYISSNDGEKVLDTSIGEDLLHAIKSKICDVSYENMGWHTDLCKEDISATSCKIFQTPYLHLTTQFYHTNRYPYM